MEHNVFISFKNENKKEAEKICNDLESKGIKCWISSRNIRGGQNYQEEIPRAIKAATVMVLVFSSKADTSDEIQKEISIANRNKKPWIPVRIEDFLPGVKFEYEMSNRQYIDLFENWDREIDHLSKDIQFRLETIKIAEPQVEQPKNVGLLSVDGATNDNNYIDMFIMAYSDGDVSSAERAFLDQKAKEFGISASRTQELEEQVKNERSGSNITTVANIVQSNPVSVEDVSWPSTGHTFIKAVGRSLDVSRLPFKPTYVLDDKEIEKQQTQPEICWSINDKYSFNVFLPKKYKDKIDVRWGIFSINAKRDPLFRKTAQELYEVRELLDKNSDISIDGVNYFLNTEEGYLGIEATERKIISEINNPEFIKHVVDNLLSFSNRAWQVMQNLAIG